MKAIEHTTQTAGKTRCRSCAGGAAQAGSEGGGGVWCAVGLGMNTRAHAGERVDKQMAVGTALILWSCGCPGNMT